MNNVYLYPSIILASARLKKCEKRRITSRISKKCNLISKNDEASFFQNQYRIAHQFFYNKYFYDQIDLRYLGYFNYSSEFGEIHQQFRMDIVLSQVKSINIYSLHLHVLPQNPEINFGHEPFINPYIIDIVRSVFRDDPRRRPIAAISEIISAFSENVGRHRNTLSFSKTLYFSVFNLPEELYKNKNDFSQQLYALVHTQPENIDRSIAEESLREDSWASTDFFVNFYQPGGMLSLSKPFNCSIYDDHKDWFIRRYLCDADLGEAVSLSNGPVISLIGPLENPTANLRPHLVRYDFLPEYPPLKYLGFLSLEYAMIYEESLRGLFERLLRLSRKRLYRQFFGLFFGDYHNLIRTQRMFHSIRNLENLKLPHTREFILNLIKNKRSDWMSESIASMNNNVLNSMRLVLGVVAFIGLMIGLLKTEILELIGQIYVFLEPVAQAIAVWMGI